MLLYIIIVILVLILAGMHYYDSYKKTIIPLNEEEESHNENITSCVLNSEEDLEELISLGIEYYPRYHIPFYPISVIIRGNKITSFGFYPKNHYKDIKTLIREIKLKNNSSRY